MADMKAMLMAKKKDEKSDPKAKEAKMKVLEHIHKLASDSMGNDVKGSLGKVEVMGSDKDSIKEGLKRAEQLVDQHGSPLDTNSFELGDDGTGKNYAEGGNISELDQHGSGDIHAEAPKRYAEGGRISDLDQHGAGDIHATEPSMYADGGDTEDGEEDASDDESEMSDHAGKAEKNLENEIDEETDEHDLSEDDIDALIADLQAKKAALQK